MAAAATKQGLRFGMTEHLAASWWFYGAQGADKSGPMAGCLRRQRPEYADLYWSGNEKPDFHYYGTNVPAASSRLVQPHQGLIDRYHPDLLYSDSPLPYPDEVGRHCSRITTTTTCTTRRQMEASTTASRSAGPLGADSNAA